MSWIFLSLSATLLFLWAMGEGPSDQMFAACVGCAVTGLVFRIFEQWNEGE